MTPTHLSEMIEHTEAAARAAWAEVARERRWTLWVRFSWAWPVDEITASKLVAQWAASFRTSIPGAAAYVGLHNDTGRVHAHALLFVPRRLSAPIYPRGVRIVGQSWEAWLRLWWPHGMVWVTEFDPNRTEAAHGRGGAAEYTARDPGAVMLFGTPPRRQ